MFGRRKDSGSRIDTLIGKTAQVDGDLRFTGGLHLDGRVTGSVSADQGSGTMLSVSETGVIEGSVEAGNVVLNGCVRGNIAARGRVVLGAKSRVEGNVVYGVIEIADGALIRGRLISVASAGTGAAGPGQI